MFEVNSKDTRETHLRRSGVFIVNSEHIFSRASIVDLVQVNVC